jgi:hypothetical protein
MVRFKESVICLRVVHVPFKVLRRARRAPGSRTSPKSHPGQDEDPEDKEADEGREEDHGVGGHDVVLPVGRAGQCLVLRVKLRA